TLGREQGADSSCRRLEDRGDRTDLRHRPGDRHQERADRLSITMTDQSTPEAISPNSPSAAPAPTTPDAPARAGLSRRQLLGTAGAPGLVLGAAGAAVGYTTAPADATPLTSLGADRARFHGKHQ